MPQVSHGKWPHATPVPPEPLPGPPRGIILLTRATADDNNTLGRRGSGYVAQVGHVARLRVPNLHRFHQTVNGQKGVPPVFDHFWEDFG